MSEEKGEEGVSLLELYNVVRHYKWWLLASPLVAGVLASIFVSNVLHPVWEASAVLEMGRVGTAATIPVEYAVNVATRVMEPSFAEGVLKHANMKPGELNAYTGSLKATKVRDSELIDVRVIASSADMAKNQLLSSIAYLQKVHGGMMAASIDKNKRALLLLTQDIQSASAEIESLRKKLLSSHDWNTFDATLSATVLKDKSAELRSMIRDKLVLEEQMAPTRTYTTKPLGDNIYVSQGPVGPNKRLIIGVAVLLGLFGALVIAFVHNAITSQSRVN